MVRFRVIGGTSGSGGYAGEHVTYARHASRVRVLGCRVACPPQRRGGEARHLDRRIRHGDEQLLGTCRRSWDPQDDAHPRTTFAKGSQHNGRLQNLCPQSRDCPAQPDVHGESSGIGAASKLNMRACFTQRVAVASQSLCARYVLSDSCHVLGRHSDFNARLAVQASSPAHAALPVSQHCGKLRR